MHESSSDWNLRNKWKKVPYQWYQQQMHEIAWNLFSFVVSCFPGLTVFQHYLDIIEPWHYRENGPFFADTNWNSLPIDKIHKYVAQKSKIRLNKIPLLSQLCYRLWTFWRIWAEICHSFKLSWASVFGANVQVMGHLSSLSKCLGAFVLGQISLGQMSLNPFARRLASRHCVRKYSRALA